MTFPDRKQSIERPTGRRSNLSRDELFSISNDRHSARFPELDAVQHHYQLPEHENGLHGDVFNILKHWPGEAVTKLPNGFQLNTLRELAEVELSLTSALSHNDSQQLDTSQILMLYEHHVGVTYPYGSNLRKLREQRGPGGSIHDRETLSGLLPELIQAQLPAAYDGYVSFMQGLADSTQRHDLNVLSPEQVAAQFEKAHASWQTTGAYATAVDAIMNGSRHFNLVIAPSGSITKEEFIVLADKFGEDQLTPTIVTDDVLYESKDGYSKGTFDTTPRFLLVPTLFNRKDFTHLKQEQGDSVDAPTQRLEILNPAHTLAYYYALRAQHTRNGSLLADVGGYQTITSFSDIKGQADQVLHTSVERDGGLRVYYASEWPEAGTDERGALVA